MQFDVIESKVEELFNEFVEERRKALQAIRFVMEVKQLDQDPYVSSLWKTFENLSNSNSNCLLNFSYSIKCWRKESDTRCNREHKRTTPKGTRRVSDSARPSQMSTTAIKKDFPNNEVAYQQRIQTSLCLEMKI